MNPAVTLSTQFYMLEHAGGVPTRHPRPTNPRTHKHTQANTNTHTWRATRLNHCKRGAYNEYTGVCVCVCACVFVYAWVRTPWVPRWHPSGAFLIDRFATRPAVRVRAAFRCLVPCSCVYPREETRPRASSEARSRVSPSWIRVSADTHPDSELGGVYGCQRLLLGLGLSRRSFNPRCLPCTTCHGPCLFCSCLYAVPSL